MQVKKSKITITLSEEEKNNFKLVNDEPIIFDYASIRGQESSDVEEFLEFEW